MTDAIVIGAGVVGLSTALALQCRGMSVMVIDESEPGAGASYGNAGYVSPAFARPLAEPGLLRAMPRLLISPDSPVRIGPNARPELLRFLLGTARASTQPIWDASMRTLAQLSKRAVSSFDELHGTLSEAGVTRSDVVVALTTGSGQHLTEGFDALTSHGFDVRTTSLDGTQTRGLEPCLSSRITGGLLVHDQHYLDPAAYLARLVKIFTERGGHIGSGRRADAVERARGRVRVSTTKGTIDSDIAVVSTGSHLPSLARAHGVRLGQSSGRGYSFELNLPVSVSRPIYLPDAHVATTPTLAGIRVAGLMELGFTNKSQGLGRAVAKIVAAIQPVLGTIDPAEVREAWVGSRPLTADGIPLVGRTRTEGVYVAGGHGMWGVTFSAVTAQVLADLVTGEPASPLTQALDPLR